jgi:hypothetical protein
MSIWRQKARASHRPAWRLFTKSALRSIGSDIKRDVIGNNPATETKQTTQRVISSVVKISGFFLLVVKSDNGRASDDEANSNTWSQGQVCRSLGRRQME